ncbi:hypothetical protein FF1_040232 [Malus domestica]
MDKSIRPTQEFEGQNKSIKSRVRSTLMIWDTFAVDKVVDVVWRGFALWRRCQRKLKWCATFTSKWSFRALLLRDSSMLGSFCVNSQYRINCFEIFAEGIHDLDNSKSKGKGKDKEKT